MCVPLCSNSVRFNGKGPHTAKNSWQISTLTKNGTIFYCSSSPFSFFRFRREFRPPISTGNPAGSLTLSILTVRSPCQIISKLAAALHPPTRNPPFEGLYFWLSFFFQFRLKRSLQFGGHRSTGREGVAGLSDNMLR